LIANVAYSILMSCFTVKFTMRNLFLKVILLSATTPGVDTF